MSLIFAKYNNNVLAVREEGDSPSALAVLRAPALPSHQPDHCQAPQVSG